MCGLNALSVGDFSAADGELYLAGEGVACKYGVPALGTEILGVYRPLFLRIKYAQVCRAARMEGSGIQTENACGDHGHFPNQLGHGR